MSGSPAPAVLGAVLAGGLSTRYGSPKALAVVGGRRLVDRVADALRGAGTQGVIAIVNDAALAREIGLPHRADIMTGAGALAGLHAALVAAREHGMSGALVLACDLPFVPSALLRELCAHADEADVVLPRSEGPRGVEPLCGYYGVECVPAIERCAADGDARLIGFHAAVRVLTLPLEAVRTFGEPSVLFRNVNAPADRDAAERIAGETSHDT